MNILFTICGRAGSRGFKNKNLKEMRNIPLAFYTLAVIKGYIDKYPGDSVTIALNTDSELLRQVIMNNRILPVKYVSRKEHLAGDSIPKVEVIQDTYNYFHNTVFDVVIDLDITSPFRRVIDIENVLAEYSMGIYDLVFTVVDARRSPYFNMVENKPDGNYRKICSSSFTTRQQTPRCYELNASIYAYNPEFLNSNIEKTILDYKCGISVMPDYLVLDIDSEKDFETMQFLHPYYCKNDVELEAVYKNAQEMVR